VTTVGWANPDATGSRARPSRGGGGSVVAVVGGMVVVGASVVLGGRVVLVGADVVATVAGTVVGVAEVGAGNGVAHATTSVHPISPGPGRWFIP
jgi:hypothetical protein